MPIAGKGDKYEGARGRVAATNRNTGHEIPRTPSSGPHKCPGELPATILRSAHLLMSPTVSPLRNGLALISFSRVARAVASAAAITEAASAFSAPDNSATAPAGPAK